MLPGGLRYESAICWTAEKTPARLRQIGSRTKSSGDFASMSQGRRTEVGEVAQVRGNDHLALALMAARELTGRVVRRLGKPLGLELPSAAVPTPRAIATTPLLGRFMLSSTRANVPEHAAGPPDYWGSRGRGFKSRRPDNVCVSAGHRLAGMRPPSVSVDHLLCKPLLEPFTRGLARLIAARVSRPRRAAGFGEAHR
jgi:hypothetical protein